MPKLPGVSDLPSLEAFKDVGNLLNKQKPNSYYKNMNYNFELDENVNMESLKILINQCWKLLPIYEGKSKDNNIVNSKEQAYENYQKHLTFLITKVSGASKIWKNNQYYIELLYILVGMKDFKMDEHDRVKYIVHHCTRLIENMKDEVLQ